MVDLVLRVVTCWMIVEEIERDILLHILFLLGFKVCVHHMRLTLPVIADLALEPWKTSARMQFRSAKRTCRLRLQHFSIMPNRDVVCCTSISLEERIDARSARPLRSAFMYQNYPTVSRRLIHRYESSQEMRCTCDRSLRSRSRLDGPSLLPTLTGDA